jgi:hypothetical protein
MKAQLVDRPHCPIGAIKVVDHLVDEVLSLPVYAKVMRIEVRPAHKPLPAKRPLRIFDRDGACHRALFPVKMQENHPTAVLARSREGRKSSYKGAGSMRDSNFWRITAVSFVVTFLYVGHGLHNGRSDGLPSLSNAAYAGGVGVSTQQGSMLYTSSQDGRTIFQWTTGDQGKPRYLGLSNTELRR